MQEKYHLKICSDFYREHLKNYLNYKIPSNGGNLLNVYHNESCSLYSINIFNKSFYLFSFTTLEQMFKEANENIFERDLQKQWKCFSPSVEDFSGISQYFLILSIFDLFARPKVVDKMTANNVKKTIRCILLIWKKLIYRWSLIGNVIWIFLYCLWSQFLRHKFDKICLWCMSYK